MCREKTLAETRCATGDLFIIFKYLKILDLAVVLDCPLLVITCPCPLEWLKKYTNSAEVEYPPDRMLIVKVLH